MTWYPTVVPLDKLDDVQYKYMNDIRDVVKDFAAGTACITWNVCYVAWTECVPAMVCYAVIKLIKL